MTEQERDESYYQMLLADGDAFLHNPSIRFNLRGRTFKRWLHNWEVWLKYYAKKFGVTSEDQIFACSSRVNPWMRLRYRIPWTDEARRFSLDDLVGVFDANKLKTRPFGLHRQTTIWQMRNVITEFGYDLSCNS